MRSFKKIISALSAAVFALTAVPFAANAEDSDADLWEVPAVISDSKNTASDFAEDTVFAAAGSVAAPSISASNSTNGPVIKWGAVTGATSYSVYRSDTYSGTKTKLKTTSYTSYCDTTAVSGKSYYYWVTAYNSAIGAGSDYSKQAYITVSRNTVLSAPTYLSKAATASGIVIKWNPVAKATSYSVYRCETYSGTKTKIKTTGYTSYCDSTAVPGKSYYYWVTAYNSATGQTSAYSTQYYVTMPATPFSPSFTERYPTGSGAYLKWSSVLGATSYTIYRSETYSGTKTKLKTVGNTYTVDTTAVPGKSYYYWVTAYNSKTGKGSAYSKQAYVTMPDTKPKNVIVTYAYDAIFISWDEVEGAAKYAVSFSTDGGKTFTKHGELTGTDDTISGVTRGTTYHILVQAYVNGAWSSYTADDLVSVVPDSLTKLDVSFNYDEGSVTATWDPIDGVTTYYIVVVEKDMTTGEYIKDYSYVFSPNTSYTTTNTKQFSFYGKTVSVTLQAYIHREYITADFVTYEIPYEN